MNSLNPKKIILIGASTGGPGLLEKIIKALPPTLETPIIIAQHMDVLSLASFAKRLERLCSAVTVLVEKRNVVEKNRLYILGNTAELVQENGKIILKSCCIDKGLYHPTIDILFESAAKVSNINISAYLLSGIGADGAKGMLTLKENAQLTVAQDEATSIVYGMPKSADELGAAQEICSIDCIVKKIQNEV